MASLQIIKNSEGYFSFVLDGDESKAVIDNAPNTTSFGSIFHFKTKNGAPIFAKQNISFLDVTYTDVADVDFTFVSAHALWVKLIDEEFFKGLNQGGGGGGSTTFQGLTDTFTFFGNDLKVPVVNLAENRLDPVKLYNYKDFIQLEDVAIAELVENKILSVAMVEAELKIVLSDPPSEPEQLANAIGFFNISDLATQTVPLAYTTGDLLLTNDGLGSGSTSLYRPFGVSSIFNTDTNRFDFNELSLGDEILLRVHVFLTTTSVNQVVKIDMIIGEGTADELRFRVADREYKNIVSNEPLNDTMKFFIGTELRKTAPGKLVISSDDTMLIKVSSFYPTIIRKDVNVINITVDEDPEADHYRGTWNATTNTPTLANGIGQKGDWYKVSVAGSYFGVSWSVGDSLFYNGTDWVLRANNNQSLVTEVSSITSADLPTQTTAGFVSYINALGSSFAVASNEERWFIVTDTGQTFKFKLRGRSFGGSEPDIVESDIIEVRKTSIFENMNFANWKIMRADALGGGQAGITFSNGFNWINTGTATTKTSTFATGNFKDTVRRVGLVSSAAINSTASRITSTGIICSVLSGFYVCADFVYADAALVATKKAAIGIGDLATGIGNSEPSAKTSCILLGRDSTDTTLQIMHNDSNGSCTKVDLGANFPANTNDTDFYRLELYCIPNTGRIFYRVKRFTTSFSPLYVTEGFLITNIPTNTIPMLFIMHTNNGTTALAVDTAFSQVVVATPY